MRGAAVLQSLLTELALVLLPRGMTPRWFSELARSAFVRAAADISRLQNGRVNHSRVAALTGLTRADVKRFLQHNPFVSNKRGFTALERVMDGWCTDPEFSIRPGQSKQLSISLGPRSFAHLVKRYGGDVTHRAVLDELRRIGAVEDSNGYVNLRRPLRVGRRSDFSFLSPVLPLIVEALRLASKRSSSSAPSIIRRLAIPAHTELDLTIVRERCASSVHAMLDGLAHSLGRGADAHRRSTRRSVSVTVLLSDNTVKRSLRKP